jgi:hypothetical protein
MLFQSRLRLCFPTERRRRMNGETCDEGAREKKKQASFLLMKMKSENLPSGIRRCNDAPCAEMKKHAHMLSEDASFVETCWG